ncbi:MAG: mechanosensitive ion channel family protein [Clostridia bacterium]|nr:mechanosensitive ion channel family protein [Clostridia bacterium]
MKNILENVKNYFKNFKITADFIVKVICFFIVVAYAVVIIGGSKFFDPMSVFWRSFNIFNKAAEFNIYIRVVSYVIFFLGASWAVRFVLSILAYPLKRGKAIVEIICSLIKYAAIIVMAYFILKDWGVDTMAILAGIGILGLIVGLGAQPLIADVIAGLFIVFEKVFDVGDIIVVDGFRGTVKEIGIRTTQIVDVGGNVKIINNSDLKTIINMTNQLSLAICDLNIEYGESLERVEAILKDNLDAIKEAIPDIKEGPFYKGVAELGDSAVVIRFVANCEEGAKYQVERDMNRQFKLLFDKNNINIPFPQIVVNQPTKFEDATKRQQKQAEKFVEEQKELSKDIADGNLNDIG